MGRGNCAAPPPTATKGVNPKFGLSVQDAQLKFRRNEPTTRIPPAAPASAPARVNWKVEFPTATGPFTPAVPPPPQPPPMSATGPPVPIASTLCPLMSPANGKPVPDDCQTIIPSSPVPNATAGEPSWLGEVSTGVSASQTAQVTGFTPSIQRS